MRVELYSKRRCPLCEDARAVLLRLRERYVFDFDVRYIDESPDLWGRYRYDVPVVMFDGEPAYTHRLDEAEVEKRLLSAGTPVAQSPARDA